MPRFCRATGGGVNSARVFIRLASAGQKGYGDGMKGSFDISVRGLAAFVARCGSLGASGKSLVAALEGTRVQRLLQKDRPPEYLREVSLEAEWTCPGVRLRLAGRADGGAPGDPPVVEEIKACRIEPGERHPEEPLHWAQALLYAAMLCKRDALPRVTVRLVYAHLSAHKVSTQEVTHDAEYLLAFLNDSCARMARWLARVFVHRLERNRTLAPAPFPFGAQRPGQGELMEEVRHTCHSGGCLIAEAPTGTGKTAAVLLPALKGLARGKISQVWFLTARTSGKQAARKAAGLLAAAGARFKRLEITSKPNACLAGMAVCDPDGCPYATGYYERVQDAIEALFPGDDWSQGNLAEAGERFRVCPHELSLDLAMYADLIACDYNHVFDPRAKIRRVFGGDEPLPLALLVDEAHNLPDRARDMFSARLTAGEVERVLKAVGPRARGVTKALRLLLGQFRELKSEEFGGANPTFALESIPSPFPEEWEAARRALLHWLEENPAHPGRPHALGLFRTLQALCDAAEAFDDRHAFLAALSREEKRLHVFCADPARHLASDFARFHASILFSGTLPDMELHRDLCGCPRTSGLLRLPSPFPPEHLDIQAATGVQVAYAHRSRTATAVSALIRRFLKSRTGATLVFFPSYAYLNLVAKSFEFEIGFGTVAFQWPRMSEQERVFVAKRLGQKGGPKCLFAVMGGGLSEAVEWPEAVVDGAVVIGVGLPQLSPERDVIRALHDREGRDGFAVAYRIPGMIRVIQAAGRVIRSPTDRGALLLVDERFSRTEYRALFPAHWRVGEARDS